MAIISKPEDQQKLIYSGQILASCVRHLATHLKPNKTAAELNQFAIDFIRSYQAEPSFLNYQGFPHALCVSVNHEVVHGLATPQKIFKVGDVVSLDLGVDYQGFFTDTAITFLLGQNGVLDLGDPQVPAGWESENYHQVRQLLRATEASLFEGIQAVKAGARVGDIGQAVNDYIRPFGYGNIVVLGGHGLGEAVHEEPYIPHVGKKGTGKLLVENMVIAIEPMITLSGNPEVLAQTDPTHDWEEVITADNSLAAHFEHTIMVTKTGTKIITQVSDEELLPIK